MEDRGICTLQGGTGGFWADVCRIQKITKSNITRPSRRLYTNPLGEIFEYVSTKYPPEGFQFGEVKKKLFRF